jgi:hypothetical protein
VPNFVPAPQDLKGALRLRLSFKSSDGVPAALNPDVSVTGKRLFAYMACQLTNGFDRDRWILGEPGHESVARNVKAAFDPALPLCCLKGPALTALPRKGGDPNIRNASESGVRWRLRGSPFVLRVPRRGASAAGPQYRLA